jgi:hypothetical protein
MTMKRTGVRVKTDTTRIRASPIQISKGWRQLAVVDVDVGVATMAIS